ncbi:MAG TPA: hypothetical protein VEY32_03750 [Flavisolibacter sp.]|nr:hypothetical protein [Flavisolibacter sp.]
MKFLFFVFLVLPLTVLSQTLSDTHQTDEQSLFVKQDQQAPFKRKLMQRNHGAIIGVQRGAGTAIELGYEAHWRKMSLFNPKIMGATTNLEYHVGNNILGYKAGFWMKQGRVNLTYGGNLVYLNDFNGHHKYGIGPAVGFRLLGFHLINSVNLLAGDKALQGANTFHMSLRYYFPTKNEFTWDRKTLKKKEQRKKEKAKRKKEKEGEEKKGIRKLLDL